MKTLQDWIYKFHTDNEATIEVLLEARYMKAKRDLEDFKRLLMINYTQEALKKDKEQRSYKEYERRVIKPDFDW